MPDRRLVLTYFYYWYDSETGGHLQQDAGLRYHLPSSPAPDWRLPAWHQKQFADMAGAGIDVALPVYWGFQNQTDAWSYLGLAPMAQGWQQLRATGVQPPEIGMFFDTTIIANRDLTTSDGMAYFYANIKDFFSRVPRDLWAMVNGGPLIFLFTSDWTAAMNQSTFDYAYQQFTNDFGVRPYIVREVSWNYPILTWQQGERVWDYQHPIQTDNSYLWGAAMHGYVDMGGVAAVGPGYDDHLIPGRGAGTIVNRQGGLFYAINFQSAIYSGKPLLAIETWSEILEGSCVCETVEFGRQYINFTSELTPYFHRIPLSAST